MAETQIALAEEKKIVTPDMLKSAIAFEEEKRLILAKYVKKNLTEGTDYYKLRIGNRDTKPSLSKPGSEKIMSLFHWTTHFAKDSETWEMLGNPAGVLCYKAELFDQHGNFIAEGRGSRDVKKDGGDANKAIKMACKSAQIDAVLRAASLSDTFTLDIEDMQNGESDEPAEELPIVEIENVTSGDPETAKKVVTMLVHKACKEQFGIVPDNELDFKTAVVTLTKLDWKPENLSKIRSALTNKLNPRGKAKNRTTK